MVSVLRTMDDVPYYFHARSVLNYSALLWRSPLFQ